MSPQAQRKNRNELSVRKKALRLASLGFFVGPLRPGSKSPGSRLGKGWQTKTSNKASIIRTWFDEHPEDGLFLHVGRSGLVVFDLDKAESLDELPHEIADALRMGVFQRSRGKGDRGHFIFRTSEPFGNSAGGFAGWGDVRGTNGAIVLAPSTHPVTRKPYRHIRGKWSNIPELPAPLRALLRPNMHDQKPALSPAELKARLDALKSGSNVELLEERCEGFRRRVAEGAARHDAFLTTALRMMQDAKKGSYPAAAGIDRLRREFESSFTTEIAGKRCRPAEGEFDGIIAWAMAQTTVQEQTVELFNSTPELRMVRRYAVERTISPLALLMVGLTRALTCVPPRYVLPKVVGTEAPLNLYIALVGQSGAGKGATEELAREVFIFPASTAADIYVGRPGSSEGIAKMYGGMLPQRIASGEAAPKSRKRVPRVAVYSRSRVLASLPEIDTLGALMGRDGNLLSATLREAWTGSRLGHDYAHEETKFVVGAKRYRFCLVVGVQPARADVLLRERDGGLLQRFLWVPVTIHPSEFEPPTGDDSDLSPLVLPEFPSDSTQTPVWLKRMGDDATAEELVQVSIPGEVREQILVAQALIRQGLTSDIEGHRLLVKEKLACAFAVLHGRTDGFSLDHWKMAELLVQISDDTLAAVRREASARREQTRLHEAELSGRARHIRSNAEEQALINTTRTRILEALEGLEQLSRSRLRRNLSRAQREVFETTISALVEDRVVGRKVRPAAGNSRAVFYFLRTG